VDGINDGDTGSEFVEVRAADKLDVQSHEHALFLFSCLCNLGIGVGKKIFVSYRQDVVAQFNQNRFKMTERFSSSLSFIGECPSSRRSHVPDLRHRRDKREYHLSSVADSAQ